MAKRSNTFSDEIRKAVLKGGRSRYRIAQQTGIHASRLSRFVAGTAGLELSAVDKLAKLLDLHVVTRRSKARKPTKGR